MARPRALADQPACSGGRKPWRFTISGAGGARDRLVVAAGGLTWLAKPQAGKELTIQLPQPGKVSIAYDIQGAAKEGVFRLELKTWDMPDWRGIVQIVRRVKCGNGEDVDVSDLTPGEYDVCRLVENLRVGDAGNSSMLDRGTLRPARRPSWSTSAPRAAQ
jgi:hypothetical protein